MFLFLCDFGPELIQNGPELVGDGPRHLRNTSGALLGQIIFLKKNPPAPACQGPQAVKVENLSPVSLSLDTCFFCQMLFCWSFVLLFRAPGEG